MKFDFCVGNPPYQDQSVGDNATYMAPVYNKFMDAAYEVAEKVELIHPARFLIAWQSRYSRSNDAIFSLSHRSPRTIIQRWDFEDRCTIKFRVVKFLINDPDTGKDAWEVLVTNLNRFEFPIAQMKELYHMRWGIETSFRDMKHSLGAIHFHSNEPITKLYEELLKYKQPVRQGRKNERNLKAKSAVAFVYRVA